MRDLSNLEEILEKAKELNESAMTTLVKEYYDDIFRYFYYRSKTKEDAEDLTSEVFVRVVSSIKTQKGNFIAWLFRISKNLLVDYYRKIGRLKETSLNEINTESLSYSDNSESKFLYTENIKKLLNFLTDEQKEVIALKFLEGYSNEEISKIINKSIGAIKLLQFRALLTLKSILKKEDNIKK